MDICMTCIKKSIENMVRKWEDYAIEISPEIAKEVTKYAPVKKKEIYI